MLRRALIAVLLALALSNAQTPRPDFFIQLADTQFGMFTNDRDFAQETANYEFAVANINRLKPRFVIICGDLINKPGDPAQTSEFQRITGLIDKSIPVYLAAGNHDVGNDPTPDSVAYYRQHFGPDYYSFREGEIYGIVLDSSVIASPKAVQKIANEQEAWLAAELSKAKASGAQHIVVFQHHSWFLGKAEEADEYFNIPTEQRRRYLKMFRDAGVRYIFAGHYHRNAFAADAGFEMVTSGPVGMPLGADPSGVRMVTVFPDRLEHTYFTLGNIPNQFPKP